MCCCLRRVSVRHAPHQPCVGRSQTAKSAPQQSAAPLLPAHPHRRGVPAPAPRAADRLQDARSQERMWWRREGDEFEPPPAGDSGDEDYSSDDEALSDAETAGEGGGRALSIQALAAW